MSTETGHSPPVPLFAIRQAGGNTRGPFSSEQHARLRAAELGGRWEIVPFVLDGDVRVVEAVRGFSWRLVYGGNGRRPPRPARDDRRPAGR